MELMYHISRKEKMNRKKCMGAGVGGLMAVIKGMTVRMRMFPSKVTT